MKARGRDSRRQISRYVDDKLTVVVLTNLGEARPAEIAGGVARIYLVETTRHRNRLCGSG